MKNEANGKYKTCIHINNGRYYSFEVVDILILICLILYVLLPFIYNSADNIVSSIAVFIALFSISLQVLRNGNNRRLAFIDRYSIMITEISLEDAVISIHNMAEENIYQY